MNKDNWLQTVLTIVSIVVMLALFLLNFSTKADIKEVKTDMNRRFSEAQADHQDIRTEMNRGFSEARADRQEIRTDLRNLNQNYINHLAAYDNQKGNNP
jgi:uncharacterized protein (DUF3084 family)